MNEYLSKLYDWISSQDTTFQGRRSREDFISKMQNDADYNQQMYTWISGVDATFTNRYTTDAFQTKTGLKKKDESQVTSQEVATGSITKEEKQPTLSDASESKFDYESFIDKDEEYALPELDKILTGKGYSIEKTGLGDALLITDNITGEPTEIDLQPISWFGNDKYKKEEISKVKKLIETPSDSKRKALSANQLEAYSEDKIAYIENLKRLYPDIQFEYEQGPENGVSLKITKGSSVYQTLGEFSIPGKDAKQFSEINNFLYQNMTDEEASSIIKKQESDEYKRIVEEFSKIEDEIDISMESAEADFFNENYFKGLFSALEKAGIEIPDEARKELESGKVLKETYNPITGAATTQVNMDATDVKNGVQKYFSSNPVAMDAINKYNLSGTIIKRKDKIDRAKKLAIEKLLEDSPGRESTKEILRRVNKDASEEQLRIETNLEMASSNLNKLVSSVKQSAEQIAIKYPGINIEVIEDGEGRLVDIISSEPVKEIDDLKREIKDAKDVYVSLANKSKYDYDKIASKAETTEKYIELSNKSYDLFDTAMADLNNSLRQLAGGIGVVMTLAEGGIEEVTGVPVGIPLSSDVKMQMIRKDMAESREKLDKAYKNIKDLSGGN